MRRILVFAIIASLFGLAPSLAGEVDLRALAITFNVDSNGTVQVKGEYAVWHDENQSEYSLRAELRQIRGGVTIATLWTEDLSGIISNTASSCDTGCKVQSCTGSCSVGGAAGKCKTMIENCDTKDGYRECMCGLGSGLIDVLDIQAGDVFEMDVQPIGADDVNPANNTLRLAFN